MSVCISAFFLERKYPLVCLFSYVWSAALAFCLLPTSSPAACLPACLPACFPGQAKPSAPSPLRSHVPYTHSASFALLLNEFHMALQAAVSAQPAEERRRLRTCSLNSHPHTQTHSPKVQRSLTADLANATVWKWPLAQSKHIPPPPTPVYLPAWLPCVKLSTESEGRMHTNVVWLDRWWAENAGNLTGWLTGLSIWHSSWVSKWLADWHVLWLTGGVDKIMATLNYE